MTDAKAEKTDTVEAQLQVARKNLGTTKKSAHKYREKLEEAKATIKNLKVEMRERVEEERKRNEPPVRPAVKQAKMKTRHYGLIAAFFLMTFLPVVSAAYYLYFHAADQYASTVGFTVRSENLTSPADLLSGLGGTLTGGGGTRDTDILYEFMRSPDLVERVNSQLDLESLYSRHYGSDPIFGYDPDGTIEDLTNYWPRMVKVDYDTSTKLIEVKVLAFEPDEAKKIADVIFAESAQMINGLSDIARNDATRYASEDLKTAVERLKDARQALTTFRLTNQIVDVEADIQGQMGLLNTLQSQQAEALIELDLLSDSVRDGDPRLDQAQRRLAVIAERVEQERQKFGAGGIGPGGSEYATIISEFERLTVDREFAERGYAAALSTFDAAKADANRESLYLAAYAKPTRAARPEYPRRGILLLTVILFSFLIWVVSSLIYYSLRERR